jgi:hypothetical protein
MSPIDRRFVVSSNWPLLVLALAIFAVACSTCNSASGFRMGEELSLQGLFQPAGALGELRALRHAPGRAGRLQTPGQRGLAAFFP